MRSPSNSTTSVISKAKSLALDLFGVRKSYLPSIAVCTYTLFRLTTVGATLSLVLEAPLVYNSVKKGCETYNLIASEYYPTNLLGAPAILAVVSMGTGYIIAGASINLVLGSILVFNLYNDLGRICEKRSWIVDDCFGLNSTETSANNYTIPKKYTHTKNCIHLALACASIAGVYAFRTGGFNVTSESLASAASTANGLFTSTVATGASLLGM